MSTLFHLTANNAQGYLTAALDSTALTFDLDTGEGDNFPETDSTSEPFWITIDDEIIEIEDRTDDTFTISERASQDTLANAHTLGTIVELFDTSGHMEEIQNAINDAEDSIDALDLDLTSVEGDIATLQIDMTSVEGDIATLQSDMTSAQDDIDNIEDGSTTLASITTLGNATIGDNTGGNILCINGEESTVRGMLLQTAGLNRWGFAVNDSTESGSDAGSDCAFIRFDDAGDALDIPLLISRATGNIAMSGDLDVSGDLSVEGGYAAITGGPDTGDTFLVQGAGWCQQTIESTAAGKDPKLILKAVTASCSIRNDDSDGNKLIMMSDTGYMKLDGSGNLYIQANCSAQSFTDRSPIYVGGNALQLLQAVKPENNTIDANGWAEVDHNTLGKIRKDTKRENNITEPGRDIGKNIQLNSAAILELLARVEKIEKTAGK